MTREEPFPYSTINAGNFFGWDQFFDSGVGEIPHATADTSTSQWMMESGNTTPVVLPDSIMKLNEFVVLNSITDNNYNENVGHPSVAVFDELQKIRADETSFRTVLSQFQSLTDVREQESIAMRLESLLGDFQDDYGCCLDAESMRTFVALYSLHPRLGRPIITAAENGILFAEWKTNDGKQFIGLEMLPTHQVRFVAFRPDAKYPQLRNCTSGITSVEQLSIDLASYDILAWACAT